MIVIVIRVCILLNVFISFYNNWNQMQWSLQQNTNCSLSSKTFGNKSCYILFSDLMLYFQREKISSKMFHVVKQLKRSTKKSHQKTRICLLCVCVESDVKTPCLPFDNMSWDNELKRSEKYWTKHTTCLSNIKHLIKYCDVFWLLSLIHVWTVLYKLFIILHNLPCSNFV